MSMWTGSATIDRAGVITVFHFIAQAYSYTQELFMHIVSTGQCELHGHI